MLPKKILVHILLTALLAAGCSTSSDPVAEPAGSSTTAETTTTSVQEVPTTTASPVDENEEPFASTTTEIPPEAPEPPLTPTTTEDPRFSDAEVLAQEYGWFATGAEVEALQIVLEVAVDGIYGRATLDAHREALINAGLSTDHLPSDQTPDVPSDQTPDVPSDQTPDVPSGQAPDAPTNVAATSMNNAVSTVTWTAPVNNGSAIFQYIVEYSTDDTTWVEAGIVDAGVVSLVINGLTNGSDYTFRVKAENSYGTSATGFSLAARPGDNPDAPTSLTASNRNTATSTVSWAAPANNGYPVTDYLIEYSTDGNTWTTFADGVSTTTSVTVTGLANDTAYTFRVSAVNAVGTSPTGSSSSITTAGPPQAPEGLYATYYDGAASTLTWTSPSDDGGFAVTDYIVEYSTDATTWVIFDDGVLAATTATVVGLANDTAYTFRVSAVNELGTGTTDTTSAQTATSTQLAAGEDHTCALLGNGAVKCWGSGYNGRLGYGDTSHRGDEAGEMGDNLPAIDLGTGRTATQISAGASHTCALLDNATVKCWGSGYNGRLGYGDTSHRGDEAGEMGDNLPVIDLGTGRTATQISAGGYAHTCALLDDATVKCWGVGYDGRLGQGDTSHRGDGAGEMGDNLPAIDLGTGRTATQIVAGYGHTCALLDNATTKCWGQNYDGKLGYGDTSHRGDGAGEMGDSLPAIDLGTGRTATQIVASTNHTCALLDDATTKCWGQNYDGQLGYGDTSHRGDGAGEMGDSLPAIDLGTGRTATQIFASGTEEMMGGGGHTCVLLDNATTKCWGHNGDGQLGYGDTNHRGDSANEMGDNLPAIDLGTGRTATQIVAGYGHTCALLDNSQVSCWGSGYNGKLGYGNTSSRGSNASLTSPLAASIDLGTGHTATQIVAGYGHTCAILDNTTTKCWGDSSEGQLGYGDTIRRGDGANEMGDNLPAIDLGTGRTATQIVAGYGHTCAILDDATTKCWGSGNNGRLGYGDTNHRGDEAGEMGDNLPAIDLGTGRTATQITAGTYHTCAILDDATTKCWGYNGSGQLGQGDWEYRGDGPNEMGDNLAAIDLGTGRTATQIAAGNYHTCAILDNATTKCWGSGSYGQIGQGDASNRGDGANEMGDNLPAIDLGTGRTATQIAVHTYHTCALLDNATVKCWGDSSDGQLGYGDTIRRGDGANEMGDNLPAIDLGTGRTATQITVGNYHTCAILDNATTKCWGAGFYGQLGQGDTNKRGDGANEMGDNLPAIDLGTGRTATQITAGAYHTCAILDNATTKCWGRNYHGQLGYGGVMFDSLADTVDLL